MVFGSTRQRPTLTEERRLWSAGARWVAGLDEVGRGAWAGPLSVGVVVMAERVDPGSQPRWLRDSKQLSEERRDSIFEEVAAWCADAAVGHASAAECDCWGMGGALRLAGSRAIAALELAPDAVLVDGPYDLLGSGSGPGRGLEPALGSAPAPEIIPVVGGDARCASVAAASVLAKVVRDRIMRSAAVHYPPYEFDSNKGYPSVRHVAALNGYGLSTIHRRSWAFAARLPWASCSGK